MKFNPHTALSEGLMSLVALAAHLSSQLATVFIKTQNVP
jgi:hypothetical protein